MSRRILVLATIAALLAAMLTSTGAALAAKGGKPGGGGRTTASLKVYQDGVQVNSVATGTAFEIRGSGFAPNSTVYVGTSGYFDLVPVTTDGSGCFSVARPGFSFPGSYTLLALAYRHGDWVITATVTLPVT
jgi:hypothetical protein